VPITFQPGNQRLPARDGLFDETRPPEVATLNEALLRTQSASRDSTSVLPSPGQRPTGVPGHATTTAGCYPTWSRKR
jgi:hypothetical protein